MKTTPQNPVPKKKTTAKKKKKLHPLYETMKNSGVPTDGYMGSIYMGDDMWMMPNGKLTKM